MFVAAIDYKNIFTMKISRFMVIMSPEQNWSQWRIQGGAKGPVAPAPPPPPPPPPPTPTHVFTIVHCMHGPHWSMTFSLCFSLPLIVMHDHGIVTRSPKPHPLSRDI